MRAVVDLVAHRACQARFCNKCGAPVKPAATAAEYKQVTVRGRTQCLPKPAATKIVAAISVNGTALALNPPV
jgi:NADH pyrophosphatase NudC (nudix superfamily)